MFDNAANILTRGAAGAGRRPKVLILFGTRPEAIKLAPVIHDLERRHFETVVVSSSQHKQILRPFLASLNISVDVDLDVMRRNQSPTEVCARVLAKLDKVLAAERPDAILVQGDTTTALAGALAGFNRRIAVGHVEAGLRSGDLMSPFPEEMNRRAISQMATMHFAATEENRRNLLSEGVPARNIFVTGNPVIDSLNAMLDELRVGPEISQLLGRCGKKNILLTTHRRESFGDTMTRNLTVLRDFVERHTDVDLLFPVHPNPNVRSAASAIMGGCDRIHLLAPLEYSDFLALMRSAWLIVSDSGGVQEEAPSLGKPLLIMRENTERPEAIAAGVAKLIGSRPGSLRRHLEDNYSSDAWTSSVQKTANPFGDGKSAARIVTAIQKTIAASSSRLAAAAVS